MQLSGNRVTLIVMERKVLAVSMEMTAIMQRMADLFQAHADAITDGVFTDKERQSLVLWSTALEQAARQFTVVVRDAKNES